MSKVIGITGGIATGKSTVSELLTAYGFKIVDADIASREAVKKGSKGLEQVKEIFGEEAIDENGEIREIMEQEKNNYLEHGYHVIMDIPLLYENELQDTVDEVWVVYTSESIQIDRLMERNNLSLEDAKARVYSQISIDKKSRMADHVIDNLGDKLELKQNLQKLLEEEGYIQSESE